MTANPRGQSIRRTIRPFHASDAPQLIHVEHAARGLFLAESARSVFGPLSSPTLRGSSGYDSFVCVTDTNEPLGMALAEARDGTYWITNLFADPTLDAERLAGGLVRAVLEQARWAFHGAVGAHAVADLPFGASFYRRHGFLGTASATLPFAVPETVDPTMETLVRRL